MNIRTTLHLDIHTAELLDARSRSTGLTRSKLIISLMHNLMKNAKQLSTTKKVVRYQNRNFHVHWKTVHIRLEDNEYSFLIEMRCFYRFSVSALICMVLHNKINNQNNICNNIFFNNHLDKNPYRGHRILDINNDMSISWHIHWERTPRT